MIHIVPGDPVEQMLGKGGTRANHTTAPFARFRYAASHAIRSLSRTIVARRPGSVLQIQAPVRRII
jgi:hypothetical protein